jgi:hypothetical protein
MMAVRKRAIPLGSSRRIGRASSFQPRTSDLGGRLDMDPRLQGLSAQLELQSKLFLNCLDASMLDQQSTTRFPISDKSVVGTIAFLLHHEAYHIGQLALLRRYTGSPAMSYR